MTVLVARGCRTQLLITIALNIRREIDPDVEPHEINEKNSSK